MNGPIIPAARAVLIDGEGRILLIRRSDNGMWALPAGGMEPGESVTECMIREVWEETGLTAKSYRPFAVYSEPRFKPPSGRPGQLLTVAFKVDRWAGSLQTHTDETTDARFFTPDELRRLPDLMPMYLECIEDCLRFDGTVIVK
jgi:ADP-ribose pyrophosphatase YjhB (NUDIX family)